ncbi:unnamed protein product [Prorocentrum cordatum]|uniref:Uncharacterized protein n=1 Tax=Prorocentrum cordatum TaxID=2364126 RepID=A0ABN9PUG0_9DINO|nr:unnamed protein product [Polarella glacialis]
MSAHQLGAGKHGACQLTDRCAARRAWSLCPRLPPPAGLQGRLPRAEPPRQTVDDACLFSPDTPDLTQAWDSSSRAAAERVALQCERTREGGRGGGQKGEPCSDHIEHRRRD